MSSTNACVLTGACRCKQGQRDFAETELGKSGTRGMRWKRSASGTRPWRLGMTWSSAAALYLLASVRAGGPCVFVLAQTTPAACDCSVLGLAKCPACTGELASLFRGCRRSSRRNCVFTLGLCVAGEIEKVRAGYVKTAGYTKDQLDKKAQRKA